VRAAAQQATQSVQAELASANEQIGALEGRLNSEREALADEKRKLESARSEMYTARQEVSRSQQQLSESKNTIEALEADAKRLRTDLIKTEQSLAASNKEGEIAQLNERLAELEKGNADLKESLEAEKGRARASRANSPAAGSGILGSLATGGAFSSTFTPSASQPLPTTSLGATTTIQSLSAKDGLIVLANGPELELAPGVEVTLIRDLKALGKIRVIQITNDLVVANILPGAKTRDMTTGSTVSLLR
jgi:predicted  nucleic acid-binding Zn-ribbon protein